MSADRSGPGRADGRSDRPGTDRKGTERRTAERKTTERKPTDRKPTDRKTTDRKGADRKGTDGRSDRSRWSGTRRPGLDTPMAARRGLRPPVMVDSDTFGRWSEGFARFMGTAWFLVGMTVLVGGWLAWNALAPAELQFDPRRLNFTLMTLILSLQASYAAPLILLAQNRQADRDRVTAEQDRDRAERALADTEYLAREVAALRIALGDVATRDFVRSELRALLEELAPAPRRDEAHGRRGRRTGEPDTEADAVRHHDRPRNRTPDRKVDSNGSTRHQEVPTERG